MTEYLIIMTAAWFLGFLFSTLFEYDQYTIFINRARYYKDYEYESFKETTKRAYASANEAKRYMRYSLLGLILSPLAGAVMPLALLCGIVYCVYKVITGIKPFFVWLFQDEPR